MTRNTPRRRRERHGVIVEGETAAALLKAGGVIEKKRFVIEGREVDGFAYFTHQQPGAWTNGSVVEKATSGDETHDTHPMGTRGVIIGSVPGLSTAEIETGGPVYFVKFDRDRVPTLCPRKKLLLVELKRPS